MYEGRLDMPDHPIVVRLTGSPLMELPTLPGASAMELPMRARWLSTSTRSGSF
jgi:hypothetical protein